MDARNARETRPRKLLLAVLVFPIAGLVGFGGSLTVRSALAHLKPAAPAVAPRPTGVDSHRPSQRERPVRRNRTIDRSQMA